MNDIIDVAQNIGGWKSDHSVSEPDEVGVAPLVVVDLAVIRVTGAIYLDDQSRGAAVEVGDVRADWMLPPKGRSVASQSPQAGPQQRLRRR